MKRNIYIVAIGFWLLVLGSGPLSAESLTEAYYRDVKFLQNDRIQQNKALNADSLNQLLDSYEDRYTCQSVQYAECVLWCAFVCVSKEDDVQAKRALGAARKLFKTYGTGPFEGKDTINEIFSLDIETNIEYHTRRYYMAIKPALQSCALKKAYFGENSDIHLQALLMVSHLYAMFGDYNKASYYHNIAYEAYVERIKTEFNNLDEEERSMYWSKAVVYTDYTTTLAHTFYKRSDKGKGLSLAASAYNAALLTKGLLLNTSTALKAAVRREGEIVEMPHLTIRWEDVADKLQDNDVAVEFYKTDDEYGAIVLKKDWQSPKVIKLEPIVAPRKYAISKKKYPKLAEALKEVNMEEYDPDLAWNLWMLGKAIWTDDLVNYFPTKGNGRVYFAPEAALQTVGIEYLPFDFPDENGHYLSMSDVYPMYRLSSTRELVQKREETDYTQMIVYGGLEYDTTMANMPNQPTDQKRSLRKIETLDYLEGTLTEADSIVNIINTTETSPYQAQAYTGTEGTENSFKSLSEKEQRLIHVATHGFFLEENDPTYEALGFGENPMSRSGLLFAGAKYKWFGDSVPPNMDDGILTALEISKMHLQGLDMVVLSACETGKGEIHGDGVFGLQRGFKIAGTKSILMSLWKVSDEATCMLMTEFYRNWIGKKMSKHDALEAARQTVRSHTEKGWDDPKYWAPFILLDGLD